MTAKQIKDESLSEFKRSDARILIEIIDELAEVYENEIPITLVLDKALSAGID